MDEPTNYLDEEHIRWLTSYLKEYPHAFILISHDTEFMNQVSNVIFHLEFSKLTRYTASYEKFLELAEINKNQHINAYEKQKEFIKKQEDFIAKNKARYSTTGRAKSVKNNLIVLNGLIVQKRPSNQHSNLKNHAVVVVMYLKGRF